MSKIIVSVILPTYNEAGNITKLIEQIREALDKKKISHEIIVVDDDSPDKTGVLAQKYFASIPYIRTIIKKKERGLAFAIRTGIEVAVGEIIIVMDTDFNHSPKLVPKLVLKCRKFNIVVGSRFIKGGGMANKTREIFSKYFNVLAKILLGSPVHDNLSGFFAMNRKQLEKLDFDNIFYGYGDYFLRLIYFSKKKNYTFSEVPSFYNNREYGESKSKFISMFYDYLMSVIELRLGKYS